MATYEYDDTHDTNTIRIKGKTFIRKTNVTCTCCSTYNCMYISRIYGDECTLECPNCGTITHAKLTSEAT